MEQGVQQGTFSGLPSEIREHIWSLALPARIVEFVFKYLDDKPVFEARVPHTAPPPLYRVSKESYNAASDYGFTKKKPSLSLIISTRCRPYTPADEWLISWDLKSKGRENLSSSPLDEFFKAVEGRKVPITFPTNLLPKFWLPLEEAPKRWAAPENMLYNRFDILALAKNHQNTDKWAAFTITLHGKEPRKLDPNLFGGSGQNPIQLVHFDDTDRIHDFYNMWKTESPSYDDRVESIFEYMTELKDECSMVRVWPKVVFKRFVAAFGNEDQDYDAGVLRDAWNLLMSYNEELPCPPSHDTSLKSNRTHNTPSSMKYIDRKSIYLVFRACYKGCCWEPSNEGKCGAAQ